MGAEFTTEQRWHFAARFLVSAIVLLTGIYVLLNSTFPDATTKWAIGAIGLVIGYWLK